MTAVGGLAVGHLGGSAGQLAGWEESPAGDKFQLWVAVLASPSLGLGLAASWSDSSGLTWPPIYQFLLPILVRTGV